MNNAQITKEDIWKLHLLLITDVNGIPGQWKVNENCSGHQCQKRPYYHKIIYPHPDQISELMDAWIEDFNKGIDYPDPGRTDGEYVTVSGDEDKRFVKARQIRYDAILKKHCEMFLRFVAIHPFFDGNKRVARILSYKPFIQNDMGYVEHPREEWFDDAIYNCFNTKYIGRNKEYGCKEFKIDSIDIKPLFKVMKMLGRR